jgi:hypothetical protein
MEFTPCAGYRESCVGPILSPVLRRLTTTTCIEEDGVMHRAIATMMGTALAALLSTNLGAQTVSYDYDRLADFSGIRTYAWVPGTNLSDELNHKRIVDAIDTQMAAKGLTKVESSANPDVLIAYQARFDKNLEINGFSTGWAGYRLGRTGTARVEEVVIGTLAVVMVSAKTRALLWRGIATREVDLNASPEKRDKNINKAAEKLFKKYPPQS